MASVEKASGEEGCKVTWKKIEPGPPSSRLNLPQKPQRFVPDKERPMNQTGVKYSGPLLLFLFWTKIRPLSTWEGGRRRWGAEGSQQPTPLSSLYCVQSPVLGAVFRVWREKEVQSLKFTWAADLGNLPVQAAMCTRRFACVWRWTRGWVCALLGGTRETERGRYQPLQPQARVLDTSRKAALAPWLQEWLWEHKEQTPLRHDCVTPLFVWSQWIPLQGLYFLPPHWTWFNMKNKAMMLS